MRILVSAMALALLVSLPVSGETNPQGDRGSVSEGPTKSLKVFILAGQSNMEGHGVIPADANRNGGQGSLEFLSRQRPDSDFSRLLDQDGNWIEREDVWIHYLNRKGKLRPGFGVREDRIGPELGFGKVVGDAIDEPVLLIKLAWGGKSLGEDFRPPSASENEAGPYYRELLARARELLADVGKEFPELQGMKPELAGMGWHQGWNDRVNQAFNDAYEVNLAHLIHDLRRDLNAPELPFVIAETGMTGENETHPRALSLMAAQAAVAKYPEFEGNVAFVGTKKFYRESDQSPSKQGYHWNSNAETYYLIGAAMGQAMMQMLRAERVRKE